jgi:hypothetical protein
LKALTPLTIQSSQATIFQIINLLTSKNLGLQLSGKNKKITPFFLKNELAGSKPDVNRDIRETFFSGFK